MARNRSRLQALVGSFSDYALIATNSRRFRIDAGIDADNFLIEGKLEFFVSSVLYLMLRRGDNYSSRYFAVAWTGFRECSSEPFSSLVRNQKGLTLVEMVVTVALLGILMAMSSGALSYYFSGRSLDASIREVTSEMREAQAMAVATGNTYRVSFDVLNDTYFLQRRQGSEWIGVRGPISLEGDVEFATSSPPSFGGDSNVDFYSRGNCEDGQLVLEGRYGKTKTIQIDGETANVRVNS